MNPTENSEVARSGLEVAGGKNENFFFLTLDGVPLVYKGQESFFGVVLCPDGSAKVQVEEDGAWILVEEDSTLFEWEDRAEFPFIWRHLDGSTKIELQEKPGLEEVRERVLVEADGKTLFKFKDREGKRKTKAHDIRRHLDGSTEVEFINSRGNLKLITISASGAKVNPVVGEVVGAVKKATKGKKQKD